MRKTTKNKLSILLTMLSLAALIAASHEWWWL